MSSGSQPTEPTSATPAAQKAATNAGVDLADVTATGTTGKVIQQDVADHVEANPPSQTQQAMAQFEAQSGVAEGKSYHYCMNENHPGVPSFLSEPLNVGRIFESTDEIPVCPACGVAGNSVPAAGADIPPESIIELQERFGR